MALSSSRFKWNSRLGKVESNNPVMRSGEQGHAVRLIQHTLLELGHKMPVSTRKYGTVDGIFGSETKGAVKKFQSGKTLSSDGVIGKDTMGALDTAAAGMPAAIPPLPARARYQVPGLVMAYNQLEKNRRGGCWGYAYAMLYSWKYQQCHNPEDLINELGPRWQRLLTRDSGLSPTNADIGAFARAAGLQIGPMQCLTSAGWVDLLRAHGPLWLASVNSSGGGLHARVLHGVIGNGNPADTLMMIADPWNARKYNESFEQFTRRHDFIIDWTGNGAAWTTASRSHRILHW